MASGNGSGEVHWDEDTRDRFRIDRARQAARILRRLGWFTFGLGVFSVLGTLYFLLTGELDAEKAFTLFVGSALVTVMAGATAYASGMNLTLSASRLARVLPPESTVGGNDSATGEPSTH